VKKQVGTRSKTGAVVPLLAVRPERQKVGSRAEGEPEPVPFLENGLRFFADVSSGQKTGFSATSPKTSRRTPGQWSPSDFTAR
jgi:23S rRNA G2069 N7-methylase RlmK/C1962 C5-methylase RlmI